MAFVRRARPDDARGIHDAHMRSIREVCSRDHSPEEVSGWGGRPYSEESRLKGINEHLVWVVEDEKIIKGYGHLIIRQKDQEQVGYVVGLYLTPEVLGRGFGFEIAQHMLDEARQAGVKSIELESSITAHGFYEKLGFKDSGPQKTLEIGGSGIRCSPMELNLVGGAT